MDVERLSCEIVCFSCTESKIEKKKLRETVRRKDKVIDGFEDYIRSLNSKIKQLQTILNSSE